MNRRINVLASLIAMAFAAGATDVEVERAGTVRCDFGGGITAAGLVNFNDWRSSTSTRFSVDDPASYVLSVRGTSDFAAGRWTVGTNGLGGVVVTNTFTLKKSIVAQAAGTRIYLPFATFKGGTWKADTGKSGVLPTYDRRAGLFTAKDVRELTFTVGGEVITFTFPDKRFVHLSNDAAWCDSFSLRLQPAGSFAAGATLTDVFTVAVKGRSLTCGVAAPITVKRGKDWIPMGMRRGIVEGGATDFSGWRLQDAPAGKHGWLKRVGGHFEFEGTPGKSVKFYGVNLVSSCCWPERKADADDMVARLVRSGYNTVRLHHFECPGGITSKTGDPSGTTLNPTRMDQMDYLVSRLLAAGLYVTIDLYSYRRAAWRSLGIDRDGEASFMEMKALIHLTDAGFANWKTYVSNLLNHVNPYTGRAYKDEPGLPLICLVNEGALSQGWNVVRELPEVSAALGRDARKVYASSKPEFQQFCMDVEARSLARMIPFVRSLGVKALITDMNNGPHFPLKQDLRKKHLDYFDNHFYVDHPQWLGERLKLPFLCRNTSVFDGEAGKFPADAAAALRDPEMPYTITEWNFSGPSPWRYQGGLYTAARAARGQWDGLWCFTWAHSIVNLFDKTAKNGLGNFDVLCDPIQQANERALVALYLRGDAAPGRDVLVKDPTTRQFTVETPRTQGGVALAGGTFRTSALQVHLMDAPGAVWATAVDAADALGTSRRILVTHLTDVQNEGTLWADRAQTIVMSRGRRPLLAHNGQAEIALSLVGEGWKGYALETDGTRRAEVPLVRRNGQIVLPADIARNPKSATLLYELCR